MDDGSTGVSDAAAVVAQSAQSAADGGATGEGRSSAACKSSELVGKEQQPVLPAERPTTARRHTSDDAEHHASGGLPWSCCRLPHWMSALHLSNGDSSAAVPSCLRRLQFGKQNISSASAASCLLELSRWHGIALASLLHLISIASHSSAISDVEAQALARRSCMPSMVQETTLRAARICAPAAARSCRIAARDEDTTPVLRHAP